MIQYFNWLPQLEALPNVDSIENELVIFKYSDIKQTLLDGKPVNYELIRTPHKFDFFILVNHISGSIKFKIDMVEYELNTPCNVIKLAPGQIIFTSCGSEEKGADDKAADQKTTEKKTEENVSGKSEKNVLKMGTNAASPPFNAITASAPLE